MKALGLLDEAMWPVVLPLQRALDEHDMVTQMKALELLVVRLAMGTQIRSEQDLVVAAFHRHVRQIIAQWRRFEAEDAA